ncbi:secreted ookinete protein 25, putative [Plasmodium yoelii]|nr:secreted ookinete protein 25, putative [Plasmodium yoelii]WBY58594.1 PIMMS43 protein [Plasmodium yoelii yoelii]CDU18894.1 conserved Plasmodium protein, unknown function [Plasmodium yoelii]VTZ79479.1 secreted ookinete protein 25, putative [Plasmodium yoelii]|eukprot:XP_731237.2 secreted ookinete protein 25, putative [Plasmodium yoelii]
MIKLCTFLSLFLIFFFLNLNAINGSGNTDEIALDLIDVDTILNGTVPDGDMLHEKIEYDNYRIPNLCHYNPRFKEPRFIEDNKDYLYNKIGEISNSFSTNLNKYTTCMHELYGLYNESIDVSMDNFRNGYIFMQIHFSKHENKDTNVKLMVDIYGSVDKIHSDGIELAQGSFEAQLNQCELIQNKITAPVTDAIFIIDGNTPAEENNNASTDNNTNLQSGNSHNNLNDLSKIYESIVESGIDIKEHFITVDKISEDIFKVNKLEKFLTNCMVIVNINGLHGNKDALKKHIRQMKDRIYREKIFIDFKQSIVKKDLEECTKNYTLLMSNSIASKLMFVFVFIAIIIYSL